MSQSRKPRQVGEYHHFLHHRVNYEKNADLHWLRTRAVGMMALMHLQPHDDLHDNCPGVPPLDIFTAQIVRRIYVPDPNPLIGIENFMTAVELASSRAKTHEVERSLAELVIHAVDLQRPFIRQGLVS